MKKKILILIIVMLMIISTGCEKKEEEKYDGKIISFSYNYGGFSKGYYNYSIEVKDDKVIFEANGHNGVDLNINKEIDSSKLEELAKLINKEKIYEWNNFEEKKEGVLDGNSFSLTIKYDDGKTITAKGYMKYPKNYDEKMSKLLEFIDSLK